jgi:hypothetical protein
MENWPLVGDRYDPYDPAHPMWADPFWSRYATGPAAARPSTPVPPADPADDPTP